MKGWKSLQRRNHSGAEAECRKAMTSWPHSALARVLRARLALQRRDADTYDQCVALATVEQLFPPLAPARQRALAEFVVHMMWVHAEKLYHDGEYAAASRQLKEFKSVVPNSPMAAALERLIGAAISQRYKYDSFQERACASSAIGMSR